MGHRKLWGCSHTAAEVGQKEKLICHFIPSKMHKFTFFFVQIYLSTRAYKSLSLQQQQVSTKVWARDVEILIQTSPVSKAEQETPW